LLSAATPRTSFLVVSVDLDFHLILFLISTHMVLVGCNFL
jgi:hypothetical protein